MKFPPLLVYLLAMLSCAGAEPPLVLENACVGLRFDARTGNWTGLEDKLNGVEWVAAPSPNAAIAPPGAFKIDQASLDRALADARAISLAGEWLYTPDASGAEESARISQGRFDGVKWAATELPSRRGAGDDRLHERFGDFWYRRAFIVPEHWPEAEMAVMLRAVDDFDVTWLNGKRIGETGAEIPRHWETPRYYRFPAQFLHRGQTNVLLVKVTNAGFDGGIDAPVILGLANALRAPEADAPALIHSTMTQKSSVARMQLSAVDGPFEYEAEFALPAGRSTFTRQLTVKNTSAQARLFQTAQYCTPSLRSGEGLKAIFPGSLPAGGRTLAELTENESLHPGSEEPLVVLWDEAGQCGLGSWFHCETEFSPVSVRKTSSGVEIRHTQNIVVRLQPGESVKLGKEHFWLAQGPRDKALRGIQTVYRGIGLRAPTNSLPGLRGLVIYCGHPGGPPELDYLRYGGFPAMQNYVPTLQKLKVDLLWLLPVWDHGDGRQWNLYSPFDHFQVDHLLGTAEQLKSLSQACATNGIRLLFDLVPHGPPDFTPLAKAHPEWAARAPEGTNQVAWGQLAFDNHHPGWQDYMRRAAEWNAREFGAAGARVDCAAGGPLNWNPALGNRPSLSSLAAGLGMCQAIREGYERAHRQAVLLPEEYAGANVYNRVADLTYDAQFYFLQADLLKRNAPPAEWADACQQFLHDQQQTLPPGALKMRWISNHDTVSWTFQKQRPAQAYGVDRMRALLALCAFIEGVPMLYQGDEDPAVYGGSGESSVDFLSRVYRLRKSLPALREGVADYASAHATDGVFVCSRTRGKEKALVLISFNPSTVDASLTMPGKRLELWTDRLAGESMKIGASAQVAMKPYQVRVFTR
jgi:hypothetical protein